SLAVTRSAMEYRAAVVAGDADGFLAGLAALEEPSRSVGGAGPVFVFPGQGAQWAGMAQGLLDSSPVFAGRLAECAAALDPYVDFSVVDALRDGTALERVCVVQPVVFGGMVAL